MLFSDPIITVSQRIALIGINNQHPVRALRAAQDTSKRARGTAAPGGKGGMPGG